MFVVTKHVFCRDKCFVTTNIYLSYIRDKQIFVTINIILSRQKLCRDKLTFVVTNMCFLQQNMSFVMTQKYACHNKSFVATNICFIFVVTKIF